MQSLPTERTLEAWFHFEARKPSGELRFPLATFKSNLDCENAELNNDKGDALFLDRANIAGDFILRNAKVKGVIRFLGSKVGADFNGSGGVFFNTNAVAIG